MDTYIYIIIGFVVGFFIVRNLPIKNVRNIEKEELVELLKDKKKNHFIDVRTPMEYSANNIKGFKNMPLQTIQNKINFPKEDPIVLICASGSRSRNAARKLSKLGYTNILNVKGGMNNVM